MIPLGRTGLSLCFWYEMGRPDRTTALNLLLGQQSDVYLIAALRAVLQNRSAPSARLTDHEILEGIANLIDSGELVLVRTNDHSFGPPGDTSLGTGSASTAQAPAPPPPSKPSSQSSSPAPAADPKIFPANINAAAMAAANQAAAQQGAPFCEH